MTDMYDDSGSAGAYYKPIFIPCDSYGLAYPRKRSVRVPALATGTVGINTPPMPVEALLSLKRSP